jgi:hypothetical protein
MEWQFQKGNHLWQFREKHGRDLTYQSPEEMWERIAGFFQWCDSHPWFKNELLKSPIKKKKENGDEDITLYAQIPTARPYTLTGLCIYLGITLVTWKEYCKRDDFTYITTHAEKIIETQQFEGAAVGAFNANIIARKQGLSDKSEHTGKDGGPIEHDHKFKITLNLNK